MNPKESERKDEGIDGNRNGSGGGMGCLERELAYSSSKELQDLCESNGLKEIDFVQHGHNFHHLDSFMGNSMASLSWVGYFPALTSLCIMKESALVTTLGVENAAANLEKLYVTECNLTVADGIEKCVRLENLHLSGNHLSKVEQLSGLRNLQLLWLNDNKLTKIPDCTSQLINLRTLWLCGNEIETIGVSLLQNTKLKELNLANNKINSFRDILNLQKLPQLARLSFSDPHFGDNPVCQLCNYQTYVIYHLTQLVSFDAELISDESKQLAMAIYLKKKMYYTMRVRTLKRNATNVISKAYDLQRGGMRGLRQALRDLLGAKKEFESMVALHKEQIERDINNEVPRNTYGKTTTNISLTHESLFNCFIYLFYSNIGEF